MRFRVVSPSAANPAKIKLTEALRSVAITGAPLNPEQGLIIALFPLISIFAPILFNSGTCMNLFSNMFSSMTDLVLAIDIKTIICA